MDVTYLIEGKLPVLGMEDKGGENSLAPPLSCSCKRLAEQRIGRSSDRLFLHLLAYLGTQPLELCLDLAHIGRLLPVLP